MTDQMTSPGKSGRSVADWVIARFAFAGLSLVRLLPADFALNVMDGLARRIGPRLKRHKLVLTNLARAFPELTDEERLVIAGDAWGSMGRLIVEYVLIDKLFDYDPAKSGGRIEVTGAGHLEAARDSGRPVIFLSAHLACFEMIPMMAQKHGVMATILFRPPNNPYIAERVATFRKDMGEMVPSHAGASLVLARRLARKGVIGVLIDQKFPSGIPTRFFGLPLHTNPLVPKLVRQFDCLVVPLICQRIEANRYRITIDPPIEAPRDEHGEVNIDTTAQWLNDKVEHWVRQTPGQWLWYHDRWNIKRTIGL